MKKELLDKISLPEGMYKAINCIRDNRTEDYAIYEVEKLGLIKLCKWNGDQFLSVSKIDSSYNIIEDLNIILKPRYWVTIDNVLHESDEVLYFYCK